MNGMARTQELPPPDVAFSSRLERNIKNLSVARSVLLHRGKYSVQSSSFLLEQRLHGAGEKPPPAQIKQTL